MMTGFVTFDREAIMGVAVRGPREQEARVEAIIDTGFNGFLTLPVRLIADLALPFAGTTRVVLRDGSEVRMDIFEAIVLWDSEQRGVVVLAAEGSALIGMSMLFGYRVTLKVEDGGVVIIEALS